MKKMIMKNKTAITGVSLVVIAMILGVMIFTKLNSGDVVSDNVLEDEDATNPVVEELVETENEEVTVEVPEIVETETNVIDQKDQVTSIEEPLPEEPEKPVLEAPEETPVPVDDLNNMDTEPQYDEEDVVIESEEVIVVSEDEVEDVTPEPEVSEDDQSDLVPASENPFLNPENAANPIESNGEDYYEDGRKAGEGDKF
ncbi:hypothetical protein KHM83_17695 [Fusibacter paucivorans]|uniref:Uncharacterized protein n=1 Tax=Fusibacter paucivorans TaxID=76009 RepID=A0ABS5PTM8_9FIRM|nr:DUF6550 family protein [Fusibacter paucivorans]MBS7528523.1 hypothetical protein [Fusibacter paucivorans]